MAFSWKKQARPWVYALIATAILAPGLAPGLVNRALGAEGRGNAGPTMGFALPSPGSKSFAFGLKLDYKTKIPVIRTALFFYTYGSGLSTNDNAGTSIEASSSTKLFGLEGTTKFFSGSMIGLKAGMLKQSTSLEARTPTTSPLTLSSELSSIFIAPVVLYDFPVTATITVGGELSYVFPFSSTAPKAILFVAAGKYWF